MFPSELQTVKKGTIRTLNEPKKVASNSMPVSSLSRSAEVKPVKKTNAMPKSNFKTGIVKVPVTRTDEKTIELKAQDLYNAIYGISPSEEKEVIQSNSDRFGAVVAEEEKEVIQSNRDRFDAIIAEEERHSALFDEALARTEPIINEIETESVQEKIFRKVEIAEAYDSVKNNYRGRQENSVNNTVNTESKLSISFTQKNMHLTAEDFSTRFDITIDDNKGKNKKAGNARTTFLFIVLFITLGCSLTLVGVSLFNEISSFILLGVSHIIALMLLGLLYAGSKHNFKALTNGAAIIMTLIFYGGMSALVQELGIYLFSQCTFVAASVVTMGILFVVATCYFLNRLRKVS